ncbi:MAG: ATP synthase delta/epsilon chain alpha-helix domain-containing protein, partial [Syntrophales bacterium]|nr:ATP synthase delta/epsilon chain alpha-helix domain-containing protein [Syntrophales bacterium]
KDGKKTYYAISTGYAEVTSSKVTILVETAERSDMIDKERAKRAKEIAESKVNKLTKEDEEFDAAKAALVRATIRLGVAEKG